MLYLQVLSPSAHLFEHGARLWAEQRGSRLWVVRRHKARVWLRAASRRGKGADHHMALHAVKGLRSAGHCRTAACELVREHTPAPPSKGYLAAHLGAVCWATEGVSSTCGQAAMMHLQLLQLADSSWHPSSAKQQNWLQVQAGTSQRVCKARAGLPGMEIAISAGSVSSIVGGSDCAGTACSDAYPASSLQCQKLVKICLSSLSKGSVCIWQPRSRPLGTSTLPWPVCAAQALQACLCRPVQRLLNI